MTETTTDAELLTIVQATKGLPFSAEFLYLDRPCQCSVCSVETERLCPCGAHPYLKFDAEGNVIETTEHDDWCPAVALVTSEPEDKVPG